MARVGIYYVDNAETSGSGSGSYILLHAAFTSRRCRLSEISGILWVVTPHSIDDERAAQVEAAWFLTGAERSITPSLIPKQHAEDSNLTVWHDIDMLQLGPSIRSVRVRNAVFST